jgi:kynurenine 3-monooxygenase
MQKNKTITIIGAGLSGCFMAILLSQKGYTVDVYESHANPRVGGVESGRSYNIQLYLRSIKALKSIGMWETVKNAAIKIEGYINHLEDQQIQVTRLNEKKNELLYQIHRQTLHTLLLTKAQALPSVTIHFSQKFMSADETTRSLYFLNTTTQQIKKVSAAHVIGADGVHSSVRPFVQKRKHVVYSQEIFPMACIEVTLSARETVQLGLSPNFTHRWPRKNAMLIGFPNKDTSLTVMLTLPLTGKQSFQTLRTKSSVQRFVTHLYPDLQPVTHLLTDGILNNPVGTFTNTQTSSWYEKDFIVLIGDAAHSMIPFYGQGVNSAFEDCLLLGKCLDTHEDYEKALTP